jgi:hypothetical protein
MSLPASSLTKVLPQHHIDLVTFEIVAYHPYPLKPDTVSSTGIMVATILEARIQETTMVNISQIEKLSHSPLEAYPNIT